MKNSRIIAVSLAAVVFLVAVFAAIVIPRRLNASAGIIRVPFYEIQKTMDAARDMIFALGWEHQSEEGDGKRVIFKAKDAKGKQVTFTFDFGFFGSRTQVAVETGTQYSVSEVTQELAQRIGMHVGGASLPAPTKSVVVK